MTLTPAYGRDYKTRKALQADFDAGKDFIINDMSSRWDGKPTNKEDLMSSGYTMVKARYDNLRKIAFIVIK